MKEEYYRYYFIIQKPDCIPQIKRPFGEKDRVSFARELKENFADAKILACTITPSDLWAESVEELIQTDEMWEQVRQMEKKEAIANRLVLRTIRCKFGKRYRKDIIECLKEYEAKGPLEIVKKPRGKSQDENWGSFKYIHVNQTENGGITGDSFSGTFAIPLPDGTFLETYYSM